MDELDQIERIRYKLTLAKNTDKKYEVFGAGDHKYILGETVKEAQILKFEKDYDLELPEDYKAFLLYIGNGGVSYANSAAGPSYGIYPLGKNVSEFIYENARAYLKENCKIYPKMPNKFWDSLIQKIENDDISDEEFDIELGKIFSGILPLGSQGCTYYHALVLNGEFKGRVVNIDIDRQKPSFAFELNFLDWYERWLDEIIPEKLKLNMPDFFRFSLGGLSSYILEVYFLTNENETKIECLKSLLKKQNLDSKTIDVLEEQYKLSVGEIQRLILQILTKFDYEKAHSYLIDLSRENLLEVFQFVFWYAKHKSPEWLTIIEVNAEKINNEETFRFCTYLLEQMNIDYSYFIIPFTLNKSENIRVSAYYSLGQLSNKIDYLDNFIVGLSDNSNTVIHSALQALNGIVDRKLLVHYKIIAEKFTKEQNYILSNLNYNLELFGLSTTTIKTINIDEYKIINMSNRKWFEFWKNKKPLLS